MADKKPMSEARKAANKKWNDANLKERYDRVQLVLLKGKKEEIKAAADLSGQSVNAYILEAIRQRMDREQHDQAGVVLVNEEGGEQSK